MISGSGLLFGPPCRPILSACKWC